MGFDLGAPANTALFLYILYSFQRILLPSSSPPKSVPNEFKAGYSWMPKAHPPTVLFKTYTPKTLEPFNGLDGGRILLAIDGTVFDVTAGRNFYGPSEYMTGGGVSVGLRSLMRVMNRRWNVRKLRWQRCVEGNGQAVIRRRCATPFSSLPTL